MTPHGPEGVLEDVDMMEYDVEANGAHAHHHAHSSPFGGPGGDSDSDDDAGGPRVQQCATA